MPRSGRKSGGPFSVRFASGGPLVHRNRETHLVIRSGGGELGRWLTEEREVWQDYQRAIRAPPARIVAAWLIAVSIFQHGVARAEYRNIELCRGSEVMRVI